MRGSKVPTKERAVAVGIALVKGVPKAAKETGWSQRNIRRWKHDPNLADLVLSAREEVGGAMWAATQLALSEVISALTDPMQWGRDPLRSKTEALEMLIRSRALLMGEATGRMETRQLTDGYSDDEKRKLRDWIDRLEPDAEDAVGSENGTGSEVR